MDQALTRYVSVNIIKWKQLFTRPKKEINLDDLEPLVMEKLHTKKQV